MLILRTFGGLSLVGDEGRPLPGAAAQRGRLAILAVLAVAGDRGVSRDRLLTLFWPESETERARGALKQALYALRSQVGEVTLGSTELRLNARRIISDVWQFEAALAAGRHEDAVRRHTGPFLEGVHVRRSPEFERWLDGERERLGLAHRHALESLARGAETGGDPGAAVAWWRQLAAADPFSARVTLAMVNALTATGDREAAIRHAELYSNRVRAELDLEPDPDVIARVNELRRTTAMPRPPALPVTLECVGVHERIDTSAVDVQGASGRTPVARRSVNRRIMIVAALILAATAMFLALASRTISPSARVLVIPLTNETGDTALTALGRLTADWVLEGLSSARLADLVDYRLMQTLEVRGDAGNDARQLSIARAAGADRLVHGAIYRMRDSLSIQLRLVRTRDGELLGPPVLVAGDAADPGPIVEAARQRVMGLFAARRDRRFGPLSQGISQPPRYDAYQAFLRGLASQAADEPIAYDHFREAAALDSTFLQAKVYALLVGPPSNQDSLLYAAERQRPHLNPYDVAALDYITAYAHREWETAWRASRRMVEIAPWSADARLFHVQTSIWTNRFAEAVATLQIPEDANDWLGPSGVFWYWATLAYHYAADFEGEIRLFDQAARAGWVRSGSCLQLRPYAALGREAAVDSVIADCAREPHAIVVGALEMGASDEYRTHGYEEAAARARDRARQWYSEQDPPWLHGLAELDLADGRWTELRRYWAAQDSAAHLGPRYVANLAIAAARLGDTATAYAIIRRIDGSVNARPEQRLFARALVLAALGRPGDAVIDIREARDLGFPLVISMHAAKPAHLLRGYPPWEALLAPRD